MIGTYLLLALAMLQAGDAAGGAPAPASQTPASSARAKANLASYLSDADYPPDAIRAEEQGTVSFRLFINAEGRVDRCEVTGSSGSASLDAATCRIMTARPRFEPARDEAGHPTTDVVSSRIRWVLPEDEPYQMPAVRAAPIAALSTLVRPSDYPAEARKAGEHGLVIFVLAVAPDGKVLGCMVPPMTAAQALADATCRIMTERARFRPARDGAGKPAPDMIPGAVEWRIPARRRK
jgi:protein TonB